MIYQNEYQFIFNTTTNNINNKKNKENKQKITIKAVR